MNPTRKRSLIAAIALFVVAFALRMGFVMMAQVHNPVRGDAVQYIAYAINLLHHGVFSSAPDAGATPVPDAFRTPGYPLLVATVMRLSGEAWYPDLLLVQSLLGAATVTLVYGIGHRMLSAPVALMVGGLLAFWPHSITISGYLITETLFGFLLALSIWFLAQALRQAEGGDARSAWWAAIGGLVATLAYLVNPVMLVVTAALGVVLVWRWRPGLAAMFLLAALLGPFGWSARNHALHLDPAQSGDSRAWINLVQGASPEYHDAYRASVGGDLYAARMMQRISQAQEQAVADHAQGLHYIWERVLQAPAAMTRWYLLDKPLLLWDWSIRMGQGDVYVYPTSGSPLESVAPLSLWKRIAYSMNSILALGTLVALLWGAVLVLHRSQKSAASAAGTTTTMIVAAVAALTGLHVVFQAEPRYAIPYRGLQFLLLAGFITHAALWVRARLNGLNGHV